MKELGTSTLNRLRNFFIVRLFVRYYIAIRNGFLLGRLDSGRAQELIDRFYTQIDQFNRVEDITRGLSDWERSMIENYFPSSSRILLLSAGSGRELLGLLKMGFEVDAYECHNGLRDFGNNYLKKIGNRNRIELCRASEVPSSNKRYDGVVIGWGAYSHILKKTSRRKVLESIRAKLSLGAPILLSYRATNASLLRRRKVESQVAKAVRQLVKGEGLDQEATLIRGCPFRTFSFGEIRQEIEGLDLKLAVENADPYPHAVLLAS